MEDGAGGRFLDVILFPFISFLFSCRYAGDVMTLFTELMASHCAIESVMREFGTGKGEATQLVVWYAGSGLEGPDNYHSGL